MDGVHFEIISTTFLMAGAQLKLSKLGSWDGVHYEIKLNPGLVEVHYELSLILIGAHLKLPKSSSWDGVHFEIKLNPILVEDMNSSHILTGA